MATMYVKGSKNLFNEILFSSFDGMSKTVLDGESCYEFRPKTYYHTIPFNAKSGETITFSFDLHAPNGIDAQITFKDDSGQTAYTPYMNGATTGFETKTTTIKLWFDITQIYFSFWGIGKYEPLYFKNVMLNKGSTALPYEPYTPSRVKAIFKSKNLLNLNRTEAPYESGTGGNTSIRNFYEDMYYIGMTANNYWYYWNIGSGTVENNRITVEPKLGGYGVVFPIKCKPNTKYQISCIYENGDIQIGFYTENGEWLSREVFKVINAVEFTTPNNCYWFTICFVAKDLTQNSTYTNIMVNEGETALPYAPYGKGKYKVLVKGDKV